MKGIDVGWESRRDGDGVGGVRAAGVEPAARLWAAAARPECAAAASGARGETSLHEEVARSQG